MRSIVSAVLASTALAPATYANLDPELRARGEATFAAPSEAEQTADALSGAGLVGVDLRSVDSAPASALGVGTAGWGFAAATGAVNSGGTVRDVRGTGGGTFADRISIDVPGRTGDTVQLALDFSVRQTARARFNNTLFVSSPRSQASAGVLVAIEPASGSDFTVGGRIEDDTPETFNDNDFLEDAFASASQSSTFTGGSQLFGSVTFIFEYVLGEEFGLTASAFADVIGRAPLGNASASITADGFRLFDPIDPRDPGTDRLGGTLIGQTTYDEIDPSTATVTTASGFATLTDPIVPAPSTLASLAGLAMLIGRRAR